MQVVCTLDKSHRLEVDYSRRRFDLEENIGPVLRGSILEKPKHADKASDV
jgi:hypothetical protein